jgi:hypothetical protein
MTGVGLYGSSRYLTSSSESLRSIASLVVLIRLPLPERSKKKSDLCLLIESFNLSRDVVPMMGAVTTDEKGKGPTLLLVFTHESNTGMHEPSLVRVHASATCAMLTLCFLESSSTLAEEENHGHGQKVIRAGREREDSGKEAHRRRTSWLLGSLRYSSCQLHVVDTER